MSSAFESSNSLNVGCIMLIIALILIVIIVLLCVKLGQLGYKKNKKTL